MIKTRKVLLSNGYDQHRIAREIRDHALFKVEPGIYSDSDTWHEVEVVLAKYPKAVLTMESAYYYYDLSDAIPGQYHLATDRDAAKIADGRVVQYFIPSGCSGLGSVEIERHGCRLRIYDRERLLIETVRLRNKLPYDLYREVIGNFRNVSHELYGALIDDYLSVIPKGAALMDIIRSEVF